MKKNIFANVRRRDRHETFTHIARWTVALALLCSAAIFTINARAQTAPCKVQTNCVVERDAGKLRGQLEHVGSASDPSETLTERDDRPRYWLRCWQRGVLINERIVLSLPPESKSAKPLTDSQGISVAAFDMKNATCLIESTTANR
jgi:hypothetical protein